MSTNTSNLSAQLAQISASLKALTESHAELLGFIKKIHATKESGAGASDNASGTENTDAESEAAPARVEGSPRGARSPEASADGRDGPSTRAEAAVGRTQGRARPPPDLSTARSAARAYVGAS